MSASIQSLRIGEVARQAGVTIDTLRFYEKLRLLELPLRTSGGFRLFSTQDVERVRFIRQVQGLGFSLGEVKQLLVLRSGSMAACSSVRAMLDQKLDKVREHIRELRRLERELLSAKHACDRAQERDGERQSCPVLRPSRKGKQ